jgi:hypothetical protein
MPDDKHPAFYARPSAAVSRKSNALSYKKNLATAETSFAT